MALVAGTIACTSGLAKRIYDERKASTSGVGIAADETLFKADCYAIAKAVVDEIQANASVIPSLLVAPSGGGPVTGTGTVT